MPTFYKRKNNNGRRQWNADSLQGAMDAVRNGIMGVNKAAREFGIPKSTLKDRIKASNAKVTTRLGPSSCLGDDAENKLVIHIKKLQAHGFAPDRESVRKWAFELAEKLKIQHKFNKETRTAGYDWLNLFLRRHPDIAIRKAEGVSIARASHMNRENVNQFFQLLDKILSDNQLHDKPANIFNTDETGLQLNNKPCHVLAAKGSKNVSSITSGEKGETISVIACCNAEGVFLPPFAIFKGKNKKDDYLDGMPAGSAIAMSQKSAYVNANIFKDWLENHFIPRKPAGTVLLILDGHTSHTNSVEVLEFCEANNVVLLCLPSHTTHYLQPLDRSFFKSLKSNYYSACNNFLKANPARKITRQQFGQLLGSSWSKSATVQNGSAGFRATGIAPFNPEIIPDYAYLEIATEIENTTNVRENRTPSPRPCSSRDPDPEILDANNGNPTPGKLLNDISPVPVTSKAVMVKKRGRQLAIVLNTSDRIAETKRKKAEKERPKTSLKRKRNVNKKMNNEDSSDTCDEAPVLNDSDESIEQWDENECAGCGENYLQTTSKDSWMQCIKCRRWLHDGCSKYDNYCDMCGKVKSKKK